LGDVITIALQFPGRISSRCAVMNLKTGRGPTAENLIGMNL
jgi:hypothetical protein